MTSDTLNQARPALSPAAGASFQLDGPIGERVRAVITNWVIPAPRSNPALLEMFRRRDREPYTPTQSWAGEFAGKYLTHAVQLWRLTGETVPHIPGGGSELYRHIHWFVGQLVELQAEDGYLGPWPEAWRLKPVPPNAADEPWDAWAHNHICVGLLLWHAATGDERALTSARAIGDLLCRRFLGTGETLHGTGVHEVNLAPMHSLALLYNLTGEARYLELAKQIEGELEIEPAGDYMRLGLAGVPFYQSPKPRWESLHTIMALPEMYYATGDERYSKAFQNLWWSMVEGDRHNNGGFTSDEKGTGDPCAPGSIETCCTVAWMAMSVEMLRLTGDSLVADELELSMLNSGMGLISSSGRWVTYDTPMDGHREASAHRIVFQARAGASELNCCSVNGPRTLGLLCEWALMSGDDGLALNYYGPGRVEAKLADGTAVRLEQETSYPVEPVVTITLGLDAPREFELALRIPGWSEATEVFLNGAPQNGVQAGTYFKLRREWQAGDRVEIRFDFRLRYWAWKEDESIDGAWLTSVYRGPVLMTFDPRFNAELAGAVPVLDAADLPLRAVASEYWPEPWMLLEARGGDGTAVVLTDFASAGAAGDVYRSWLPVLFAARPESRFSKGNALRTFRL